MANLNSKLIIGGTLGVATIGGVATAIGKHISNRNDKFWNEKTNNLAKVVVEEQKKNTNLNLNLREAIQQIDVDNALELNQENNGFKYFDKAKEALKNWCFNSEKKETIELPKKTYCQ